MTRILVGDARERLSDMPGGSVHCVVTSPPYWGLRAYRGEPGMIGLEPTLDEHIVNLVAVFREVRRVLRDDGTLWLNYGDAYNAGTTAVRQRSHSADVRGWKNKEECRVNAPDLKPKDLMLMPARVALALQADGWWVRSEVVWHKPNPMPESVVDRPTSSHEKLFLFSKAKSYFYDAEAVRVPHAEPWRGKGERDTNRDDRSEAAHHRWNTDTRNYNPAGANLRNVWTIPTHSFGEAHFATFPPALVEPCIRAGTSERGVCAECGAPWVRVVETKLVPTAKAAKTFVVDERDHAADANSAGNNRQKDGHRPGWRNESDTKGWRPSCACRSWKRNGDWNNPVPATVLDPFGGAGTVGLVAQRLVRDAVLIEISPDYAAMAEKRIRDDAPLLADVRTEHNRAVARTKETA